MFHYDERYVGRGPFPRYKLVDHVRVLGQYTRATMAPNLGAASGEGAHSYNASQVAKMINHNAHIITILRATA
jgi:hypothetical protein